MCCFWFYKGGEECFVEDGVDLPSGGKLEFIRSCSDLLSDWEWSHSTWHELLRGSFGHLVVQVGGFQPYLLGNLEVSSRSSVFVALLLHELVCVADCCRGFFLCSDESTPEFFQGFVSACAAG